MAHAIRVSFFTLTEELKGFLYMVVAFFFGDMVFTTSAYLGTGASGVAPYLWGVTTLVALAVGLFAFLPQHLKTLDYIRDRRVRDAKARYDRALHSLDYRMQNLQRDIRSLKGELTHYHKPYSEYITLSYYDYRVDQCNHLQEKARRDGVRLSYRVSYLQGLIAQAQEPGFEVEPYYQAAYEAALAEDLRVAQAQLEGMHRMQVHYQEEREQLQRHYARCQELLTSKVGELEHVRQERACFLAQHPTGYIH